MSSLAIITARGGSKRIPRKNIKEFCGKPIIAYSIDAALKSGIFDEVMVSTDDTEIAAIAKQYGAQVPFMRSAETSNDFATTMDVLKEVVGNYKDKLGKSFDYICCIYPTAPFITSDVLKECYEMIAKYDVHEIIPIVAYSFPPQRALVIDKLGNIKYKWPENENLRSQDLEKFYHDAGQFYFYNAEMLYKEMKNIIIKPYILSELKVQDIDNLEDWKIAELKYKLRGEI